MEESQSWLQVANQTFEGVKRGFARDFGGQVAITTERADCVEEARTTTGR